MKKNYPLLISLAVLFLFSGAGTLFILTSSHPVYTGEKKTGTLFREPGQEPNDWMAMQRMFPYDRIKPEAYLKAAGQAHDLMKAAGNRSNPWSFAGPDNIGGRITDVEFPQGNTQTIYVGAASGGVLKTTDGGITWNNLFDDVPVISVGDIAIDPNNPDILYAGTGEANASSFSFLGNGIYKSNDGGASWQHLGLDSSGYIGRIVVDYSNSQRVFVASCGYLFTANDQRGVYRSTDGGQSFQRVLFLTDSTSAVDLVQDPVHPLVLYATMWERIRPLLYRTSFGETSGLWKTTDGGDTWTELTSGLPSGTGVGRIGIDIARSNPDILYAFYDLPDGDVGVYKTANAGQTWTRTNDGALYGMNSNFGWYFGQIRIDPTNPNRVFVMGVYLYRTENGGTSWSEVGSWTLHVDHHAMAFDGTTGKIIEGNDGGLYTSLNHGTSWTKINNLPLTQFYAIDIDHLLPQRIYGGTQDNNTIRTLSGGTSDWEAILGGDGMYTLVDHTNSDIIYAEYQWGNLYRSTDGGYSLDYIAGPMSGDRVNWSAPLAMDPENSSTLYFGTYRIWKSTDKGNSWEAVSGDLTHGIDNYFCSITTIAISPLDPSIVIAGSGDGKVHISTDAGSSWQDISAGLPQRWITRVATDPFDAQTIYTTLSGFRWDEPLPHVFKSTNLGQTWIDITGNLPEFPVNDIVLDPDLPGRIIVSTDAGVYGTIDGGQTWSWIWDGLPSVAVCALKVHKPTRTVVAGSYGLSAYKASLDEVLTGITSHEQKAKISLWVSPNPVFSDATIRFYLPQDDRIDVKLIGLNGKTVRLIYSGPVAKGERNIHWTTDTGGEEVPPGLYLVAVEGTQFTGVAKIVRI